MADVISEYQKWKQQGDDLRLKAKQAMESRFRELLSEAAQIAEEYRADFAERRSIRCHRVLHPFHGCFRHAEEETQICPEFAGLAPACVSCGG